MIEHFLAHYLAQHFSLRLFPAPCLEKLTTESYESISDRYRPLIRWRHAICPLWFIAVAFSYYVAFHILGAAATFHFGDAK
jgi:hypothetical protein